MSVRVRYAPSPTGSPHVGNMRDALFKFLFAQHYGGVHILRIEDTDRTRFIPGCEDEIIASLRWLKIEWQEGVGVGGPHGSYRQSERQAEGIYQFWIEKLLDLGHAYWAFDSSEELSEMREFQQINKQPVGYFGGLWRDAVFSQVEEARRLGKSGVVRLRIPRDCSIVIEDEVRGRIEWDSNHLDDPVLLKADGMPTYHFAAMVDDHLMGITHIIRGEEWISSAPKHAFLFDAFGWDRPVFVHSPIIKGKDGSKLSKRHGDTRCFDYRSAGYLPEALVNFIALIGWSPGGDREIMSMDEMIEAFTLKGIQPSPGVFDLDKLKWMNGHHIRSKNVSDLVDSYRSFVSHPETTAYWASHDVSIFESNQLLKDCLEEDSVYSEKFIILERERVQTLAEIGPASQFFLVDVPVIDESARNKWLTQSHVPNLLSDLRDFLFSKEEVTKEDCEEWIRQEALKLGFEKLGQIVHPLRVVLTGKTTGPGLYELMEVLGPKRMIHRLEAI